MGPVDLFTLFPSRAPILSFAHYFQVPATQATKLVICQRFVERPKKLAID